MDLVDRIREEMELQEIKQKDIVEFLDVKQGTFAKWISIKEENRRDIPNTILAKIAAYLNVDIEYLLGMQEEKRKLSLINLDADFSAGLEELLKDYMELDAQEQEMYKAEIKAKAMRKKLDEK